MHAQVCRHIAATRERQRERDKDRDRERDIEREEETASDATIFLLSWYFLARWDRIGVSTCYRSCNPSTSHRATDKDIKTGCRADPQSGPLLVIWLAVDPAEINVLHGRWFTIELGGHSLWGLKLQAVCVHVCLSGFLIDCPALSACLSVCLAFWWTLWLSSCLLGWFSQCLCGCVWLAWCLHLLGWLSCWMSADCYICLSLCFIYGFCCYFNPVTSIANLIQWFLLLI